MVDGNGGHEAGRTALAAGGVKPEDGPGSNAGDKPGAAPEAIPVQRSDLTGWSGQRAAARR